LPRRISFIAQTWTKPNEKEISHGRVSWQTHWTKAVRWNE
jgi:hypothetical protein